MSSLRIVIFGGHGKVAQHLTRHALAAGHTVYPVLRQAAHADDLPQPSGSGKVIPIVESVESASVQSLAQIFQSYLPNVVVWSAGAGGKGGPERTRAVDLDGAVKVFDAIETSGLPSRQDFRRFIMVSAIDTRDMSQSPPEWYTPEDVRTSQSGHEALKFYYEMKLAADRNLIGRTFPWFILRPSWLKDGQGSGLVNLGARTSIKTPVLRDDVGRVLLRLAEEDKGSLLDRLALDLTNGQTPIDHALAQAGARGRTDFTG